MKRQSESVQPILALVPQTISNTNVTGLYMAVKNFQRILFTLIGGALAATKTTILALYEATDENGTGAQAISAATCTTTANTKVIEATVALASVGAADVVTINGLDFTCGTTAVATRTFADAAGLVLCVNNATYGVPGVEASANGTDVTLYQKEPGGELDTYITVSKTEVGGTVTLATTKYMQFIDFDVSQMDLPDSFSHLAVKVTSTGAGIIGVLAQGYGTRHKPNDVMGSSAVV